MRLSQYSIEPPAGAYRLCAIAPGAPDEALKRLCRDDPLWNRKTVRLDGSWTVDVQKFRCRPKNTIVFWMEGERR